jgi:hypothetical protein
MVGVELPKLAVVLGLATLVSGCDHTRRIRQSATLEFSGPAEYDLPLCGSVSIREDVQMDDVDRRREAINPGRFDSLYPWHGPVKIDDNRQASFTIEEVMIVSTADETPPLSQHPLSNKSFLVKIEGCGIEHPAYKIDLVEGKSVAKEELSVKVTNVSEAVYLDVDN